jgi:hypothetical protein
MPMLNSTDITVVRNSLRRVNTNIIFTSAYEHVILCVIKQILDIIHVETLKLHDPIRSLFYATTKVK